MGKSSSCEVQAATDVGGNNVFVPDGTREQALHAIGPGLSSLFSNLPAIFSGNVTQDRLQVEQHVLMDFGARKARTQTLMQEVQAPDPGANRQKDWLDFFYYGMLRRLHAFLLRVETAQTTGSLCW
jgi:hypothetical protein